MELRKWICCDNVLICECKPHSYIYNNRNMRLKFREKFSDICMHYILVNRMTKHHVKDFGCCGHPATTITLNTIVLFNNCTWSMKQNVCERALLRNYTCKCMCAFRTNWVKWRVMIREKCQNNQKKYCTKHLINCKTSWSLFPSMRSYTQTWSLANWTVTFA